jgi:high-affinity Fe2+/Pb2+ permease
VLDFATLFLIYLLVARLLRPSVHRTMLRVSGVLLLIVAAGGIVMTAMELWPA